MSKTAELSPNVLNVLEYMPNEVDLTTAYNWYVDANLQAQEISKKSGLALAPTCAMISALSINTQWEKNITLAHKVAELFSDFDPNNTEETYNMIGHMGMVKKKVITIFQIALTGETDIVAYYEALSGSKVKVFATNIFDPFNKSTVTIDRHAVAVAFGLSRLDNMEEIKRLQSKTGRNKKFYDLVASVYVAVAVAYGIPAHLVQSITWVNYRVANGL